MRILISGLCGFVGSTIARRLREVLPAADVFGFDNFSRPGSEQNRLVLRGEGIAVRHADLRCASDIEALPEADWVIDAAANPSVLAGVDGRTSSRQLVEHNLGGTVNLLEYCKAHRAGFILLSTSRVYSIKPLAELKVAGGEQRVSAGRVGATLPAGLSAAGDLRRNFPVRRRFRSTARRSWLRNVSRWNTERRLIFRSGSIAAACSRVRDNSDARTRGFSVFGLTPGCDSVR